MTGNISYENLSDSLKQKLTESNVDIVNDLTTGGADSALSAEMGKVLNDRNPEYGVQRINDNHAIRRFPIFDEWENNTTAEPLRLYFPDVELKGELKVRVAQKNAQGGTGEIFLTFARYPISTSNPVTYEYGIQSMSTFLANNFILYSAVQFIQNEDPRAFYQILKKQSRNAIYIEVEFLTASGNAVDILEGIELKKMTPQSTPSRTSNQKSIFKDAQNAVTRSIGGGTYYINPTTGDDATGEVGNTAKKFKTINAAINQMPKYLDGTFLIALDEGTYSEYVFLKGFIGSGTVEIRGGTNIDEATKYKVMGVHATGCNVRIHTYGLNFYGGNNQPIYAIRCSQFICAVCTMPDVSVYAGVTAEASNVSVMSCTINNKAQAINALDMSTVSAGYNSGFGNVIGLRASAGATIVKYNSTITGSQNEEMTTGGLIRG